MNKNIFKYLRKRIFQHSTITEEFDGQNHLYKITCLGFNTSVIFSSKLPSKKFVTGMLIDKLVENPAFLNKMEQIENRENNLKSLLD